MSNRKLDVSKIPAALRSLRWQSVEDRHLVDDGDSLLIAVAVGKGDLMRYDFHVATVDDESVCELALHDRCWCFDWDRVAMFVRIGQRGGQ